MNRAVCSAATLVALIAFASTESACNRGRETCSFSLFNNTSYVLNSFWASPVRVKKWEEDILGRQTLSSGGEVNVNLSDRRPDCIYDFRFSFEGGDEVTRERVNVCKLGRYTLDD